MGRINLFVIIAFIAGLSFDCQSSDIININPAKIKESDFDNYWVPYAAITDSNVDKDDGKPLPRSFPQLSKKQKKKQKRAAKREKNNKSNKSKKRSNATNNYKKKGDNNVNIKVVATDDLIKEMWSFLRGVPSVILKTLFLMLIVCP